MTTPWIALALLLAAPVGASEPHLIRNPETPGHGVQDIELEELWRVGDDEEDVLLGALRQMIRDEDGNVYVLDGQLSHIHVFSPDGELLRTMGRDGEGPGEFRHGRDLFFFPNGDLGIVQVFPGRILRLSRQGDPRDSFEFPEHLSGGYMQVYRAMGGTDRILVAAATQRSINERERVQETYLKAFDENGRELAHYWDESMKNQYGGMKFREPDFTGFESRWALAPDGRVAVATGFADYAIRIWDADGELERVVERPDYEPLERTAEERDLFQRYYDGITQWNPGSDFETSPVHEAVSEIQFNDDGTLWVQPAHGTWQLDEGVLAEFDVHDRQGRFVRRVRLHAPGTPGEDGIFLAGDRVYVVTQLFDVLVASLGTGDEGEPDADIPPIEIIAYRFKEPVMLGDAGK